MEVLNRAKHLYSEDYIISPSIKFEFNQMYLFNKNRWVECEQSTRSVSLSGMLDLEGNKIFASLSDDGLGGDILNAYRGDCIALMVDGCMKVCNLATFSPEGWNVKMDRLEEFYNADIKTHACTIIGIKGE